MSAPLRLLLVQAQAEAAETLLAGLRRAGFAPETRRVETGEELRSALKEGGWDLIFPASVACDLYRRFQDESERQYQRLVESLGGRYFFYRHDTKGIFTYLSPSVTEMLGYLPEEFKVHYSSFLTDHPINQEVVRHTEASLRGEIQPPYEVEIRCKDGSLRRLEVTETPLRDPGGAVGGVEGIARDITERKAAEERLLELRAAVDQAFDGIAMADMEGRVRFVNAAWARMHGWAPEELLGKNLSVFHTAEQNEKEVVPFNRRVLEKGAWEGEVGHVRRDGTLFPTWMSTSLWRDEEGRPIGFIGIARDIIERKRSEQELRESKALVDAIIENVPLMIFLKEAKELRFALFNRAGEELLGLRREQLLGKNDRDFFPPGQADYFIAKDREILENAGGLLDIPEEPITTGRGETRMLHTRKVAIPDADGKPAYLLGISEDVTERKQAEDVLRASEAKYRALVDSTDTGYLILDKEGRVVDANAEYVRLSGHRELAEILGKSVVGWTAPHMREANAQAVARCAREGFIRNLVIEYADSAGRLTPVEVNATVIGSGEDMRIVSLCRDISERRRAEEALATVQKLESLGTLAGGIAHDFNNTLTAIMGNLSLFKERWGGEPAALELLQEIQAACGTAKGLSQQLLTFARGGSPVAKVVDLRPLLTRAAGFAVRGSSARCVFELGEEPLAANVDREQVAQVVQNLVLNAVQAMPAGGTITLRARAVSLARGEQPSLGAGRYVCVSIADQGEGIPRENLSRIFDPYFSTKAAGRGLGLSVCYSIMGKHGGCIAAESPASGGAVFTLYFPAADPAEIAGEAESPVLMPGSGRILVMEDELVVAKALKSMLEHLGFQSDTVGDGKAAVAAYRKAKAEGRPYDAVILDLIIPAGLGGKETMAELAQLDPDARGIVSSGYSDDPILSAYEAYGFSAAIVKPYGIEELSETIHRVLTSARS